MNARHPITPITPVDPVGPRARPRARSSREVLANTTFPSTGDFAQNISFRLNAIAEALGEPTIDFDGVNDELRTVLSDINVLRDRLHIQENSAA